MDMRFHSLPSLPGLPGLEIADCELTIAN
jgi:hypothetical protein